MAALPLLGAGSRGNVFPVAVYLVVLFAPEDVCIYVDLWAGVSS